MFWKKATPAAGRVGLAVGTLSALGINILIWIDAFNLPGQGGAFLAASVAFVTDVVATIIVSQFTTPKPAAELRGFVYSETPLKSEVIRSCTNCHFYAGPCRLQLLPASPSSSSTSSSTKETEKHSCLRKSDRAQGPMLTDIRFIIASALGLIGIFLIICSFVFNGADEMAKTGGINANLWSGLGLSAVALIMGL